MELTTDVEHYLAAWSLSAPQLLAETRTSRVYVVTMSDGTRAVLKLLAVNAWEERNGATALEYFNGRGAVRLYRNDGQAQLMEYADGNDLIPLVKGGEDTRATSIIATVLNELHSVSSPVPDTLVPLRRWFRDLFRKADEDARDGIDSLYIKAAAIAEEVLSAPLDAHVLHGDIHHQNLRHSGRGWLAFDAKGLLGERTFDAANTLCNPDIVHLLDDESRLMRNAEILAEGLNVERDRLLRFTFIYACLSASWSFYDGVPPGFDHLKIARFIEPYLNQA